MRSGNSLINNLLSVHSNILVLITRVNFFRFYYKNKKYEPLSKNTLERMLYHLSIRLRYRYKLDLEVGQLKADILKKGISYPVIYDEMMTYFLTKSGRKIWGESVAMNWREIPSFLKFFPRGKAIHLYRDPRAVTASWKKLSSMPNNEYLNCIFNWVDSINYVEKYTNMLSANSYFPIKYEDLVNSPEEWTKKLCNFLEVPCENGMLEPEKWKDLIGGFVPIAKSSYAGDVVGFSPERAARWKNQIEDSDLCLIETLAGDLLEKYGFKLRGKKFSPKEFAFALEKLKKSDFLLKNLYIYLTTGEGSGNYPNDPADVKYWGVANKNTWWVDTPEAKQYLKEIEEIDRKLGFEVENDTYRIGISR